MRWPTSVTASTWSYRIVHTLHHFNPSPDLSRDYAMCVVQPPTFTGVTIKTINNINTRKD